MLASFLLLVGFDDKGTNHRDEETEEYHHEAPRNLYAGIPNALPGCSH
jgi:hypothetical protein